MSQEGKLILRIAVLGCLILAGGHAASAASTGRFNVSGHASVGFSKPGVAALGDGGFVVVWETRGRRTNIDGRRYDAAGVSLPRFRVPKKIRAAGHANPSVAGTKDGGFVVVWQALYDADRSDYGIHAQRFGADQAPVGDEFLVNTRTREAQTNPSVAGLADGGFVVVWQSFFQDRSWNGISGQRYGADGTPVGSEFRVNETTEGDQTTPSVTALSDGGFVVAWESLVDNGSAGDISVQRYDAAGRPVGSQFRANKTIADTQETPSVAGLADGGFVVVWNSDGISSQPDGIFGHRFSATGASVGRHEFPVSAFQTGAEYPSVAGLGDGGFIVTWGTSSFEQVHGRRYTAAGEPTGAEFQVGQPLGISRVAGLVDGGFIVVWTGGRYPKNRVYGHRFGP
jgi:hypothetical protein